MTKNNKRKKENSQNMQTASRKTKSKKSRKIGKAKSKKPKPIKSTAKKVSGKKTDVGKLFNQKGPAQDPNADTNSIDPKESNKKSDTVEESNGEELKQERTSFEEALTEIINTNKITGDAQAKQEKENNAVPKQAAARQSKVYKSQLPEADVSSDQENISQDPNAADDVAEVTAEAPGTGSDFKIGEVSEAIRKIAQSSDVPPGQSETTENSTPDVIGDLFEICANDIMQNQLTWASPDDSLQQAFAKMQQTDAGYIMIGLGGALEGIVSKSDITRAMSPYLQPIFAKWRRPLDDATLKIRIKWIMSRPVRTIKPETSLVAIMEHMIQFRGRCLPVTDEEGNVQGLVTAFDIFQALLKDNLNTCSTGETSRELVKTTSSTQTT